MNTIKIIIKFLTNIFNYISAIVGSRIISWIIWARFIRERLPKDIPFELTEIRFYVLLGLCMVYVYIIKNILFPKESNKLFKNLSNIFYAPLRIFDKSIKNNKYVINYYNNFIEILLERLWSLTAEEAINIYICYNILPRAFLVTLLCFNVFYFYKLELIYNFILIGIIPLVHRYMKYSLKYAEEQYTKYLDERYEKIWVSLKPGEYDFETEEYRWDQYDSTIFAEYHNKFFTIEEYLKFKLKDFHLNKEDEIEFECIPLAREKILIEYKKNKYKDINIDLTKEDHKIIDKEFYKIEPNLVDIYIFLNIYASIEKLPRIKYTRILIYIMYLICWTYILYVSYPNLEGVEFPITEKVLEIIINLIIPYVEQIKNFIVEPFSDLFL